MSRKLDIVTLTGEEHDELLDELEYLRWFRSNCDFGPAHGDVVSMLNDNFTAETGKSLPAGWNEEEG